MADEKTISEGVIKDPRGFKGEVGRGDPRATVERQVIRNEGVPVVGQERSSRLTPSGAIEYLINGVVVSEAEYKRK